MSICNTCMTYPVLTISCWPGIAIARVPSMPLAKTMVEHCRVQKCHILPSSKSNNHTSTICLVQMESLQEWRISLFQMVFHFSTLNILRKCKVVFLHINSKRRTSYLHLIEWEGEGAPKCLFQKNRVIKERMAYYLKLAKDIPTGN